MSDGIEIYADIIARLPAARRTPKGYAFRCPFGDRHKSGYDRNPSASAWVGNTGQLLVGCFGCHADLASWWIEQEERIVRQAGGSGRFRRDRPGYRAQLEMVQRPGLFDGFTEKDELSVNCSCTD